MENKLRPYRRVITMGRPLPMLMVRDCQQSVEKLLPLAGDQYGDGAAGVPHSRGHRVAQPCRWIGGTPLPERVCGNCEKVRGLFLG